MGAGGFFLKPAATFPLIKFYGMSLLSAWSISLDSTFKEIAPNIKNTVESTIQLLLHPERVPASRLI